MAFFGQIYHVAHFLVHPFVYLETATLINFLHLEQYFWELWLKFFV